MFIGIPLLFILISVAGIVVIVARKFPSLERLGPDIQPAGHNILHGLFPEALRVLQKLNLKGAVRSALAELEKILRKMRLALLASERMSERMIHSIRKVQKRQTAVQEENRVSPIAAPPVIEVASEITIADPLHSEERRLILAIAQNPKDYFLYSKLGEVYASMGNLNDAKESFKAALRLKPDNQGLAQKLSIVLEKILQK